MLRDTLIGTVAGAVGTVALNVTTYADMAIRGRPASSAPSKMVNTLVDSRPIRSRARPRAWCPYRLWGKEKWALLNIHIHALQLCR